MYMPGDKVTVIVGNTVPYGVFVRVDGVQKGLIHNSGMVRGQKEKLTKCHNIHAGILDKNEKGYAVTLKES